MRTPSHAAPLLALALFAACRGGSPGEAERAVPWALRQEGWRTDPAWYDGRAEKAVYDATRVLYGIERDYPAVAYTNKERYDPETTVKSSGDDGLEVFKHHWSERAPTENYDYDYSTSSFVGAADLTALKLSAATQEDCGASFKVVWRGTQGGALRWFESVYFPGAGQREGTLAGAVHFADSLTLVLRDYPFEAPVPVELALVPSQRSTRQVPLEPVEFRVEHRGRERLELPAGALEAEHLSARATDGSAAYELWFAAEGAAPWLHVLLQYEDHEGTRFRLRSLERTAYWER
jgi:hypothetical protein